MATTAITSKDEFTNTTDGWVGAVQLDHQGKAHGVSVEPGGSVFLNEDEQILTANAPRLDQDNPFLNGSLKLRTRAVEIRNRRPFGDVEETVPSETGATPEPVGEPVLGSAARAEEVATPAAVGRGAMKKK
jgi:hypothetical protein